MSSLHSYRMKICHNGFMYGMSRVCDVLKTKRKLLKMGFKRAAFFSLLVVLVTFSHMDFIL